MTIEGRTSRPKYWLVGISKQGIPFFVGDDSIDKLKEIGADLTSWSIFINDKSLTSSVQEEYLVESHNDPVWGTTSLNTTPTH